MFGKDIWTRDSKRSNFRKRKQEHARKGEPEFVNEQVYKLARKREIYNDLIKSLILAQDERWRRA